jgi:hypothetical protein
MYNVRVQYNTPSNAHRNEVVYHVPYRQQIRALPTTVVRYYHRSKLTDTTPHEQGPFCTPYEKLTLSEGGLCAKTLQFKLWTLVKELEAIGETDRVCLAGIRP